jgi:uroporphyrinogen decarboxylase
MNSYERFLSALNGQMPDRVPIFELYIHPKIIDSLIPGADLPQFAREMELDAISSLWLTDGTIQEYSIDDRTTRDEWGVTWRYGAEGRAPVDGPIKSLKDARQYTYPDPTKPHRLEKLRQYIKLFKGDKAVIFQGRYGFMWAADLRRLDVFMIDLLENPKLAHELLDITNEFAIKMTLEAIHAGADVIVFGDDMAFRSGPLVSPKIFREFLYPRLEKAVEAVKSTGALCIIHSDGNIWPLLDMFIDTGADGINPIEPVAGMDISEVKRKYGERVCILGNIDCGELLSQQTPEVVKQVVKNTIKVAAPGGGYIMSSSNAIHSSVKPQNYFAMIEATKLYGSYPLELD